MKSNQVILNWGCIRKKEKGYRKALRQCKKNKKRFGVGFDNSETWNLDHTFFMYLYNTRWIREMDDFLKAHMFWEEDEYVCEKYNIPDYEYNDIGIALDTQVNLVFSHIEKLDDSKKKQLCDFLIPRLTVFKENLHGYPACMTEEEWNKYIDDTIEELKQLKFDNFKYKFGAFWD